MDVFRLEVVIFSAVGFFDISFQMPVGQDVLVVEYLISIKQENIGFSEIRETKHGFNNQ